MQSHNETSQLTDLTHFLQKKKKKCCLVKGLTKRLKKLINDLNIYYRQILHLILSKSQSTFG